MFMAQRPDADQLHVHVYLSISHMYISVYLTSISQYISGKLLPCPLGFYQGGIFGPV